MVVQILCDIKNIASNTIIIYSASALKKYITFGVLNNFLANNTGSNM